MGRSVLVVDDDDDIRFTLRLLLSDAGYAVLEARDGVAALAELRRHDEAMVVLLDLHMPLVDGYQVLSAVADDTLLATRHAYVLVTAMAEWLPDEVRALLHQLDADLIKKPFDIDRLLLAVEAAERRLAATALPDQEGYGTDGGRVAV